MRGPNLSISANVIVLARDPPLEGADLNVAVTVHSTGIDPAGALTLTFYDGDPRAGGTLLAQAPIAGLVAGASTVANLHLSSLSMHGDHIFYAFADSANVIAEQNETDNL